MKPFKWTVPQPEHSDPKRMNRCEFAYWARVRARGPEWFVVQKGLLFVAVIPATAALTGAQGVSYELATLSWFGGLCAGTLAWLRREARFDCAREAGMRVSGDDRRD